MKFPFNGQEWYIDGYLASVLKSIAYNLPHDWDTVLLITGDRSVRVGKSVLAMTVCAYLNYIINESLKKKGLKIVPFSLDDCYFDNKKMMEHSQTKPKLSINWYDEGREGLAAIKAMKDFQQDLMDFFAECGQLNQCFVIVCPDFFELKETIAVARSECLINVYRRERNAQIRGESIVVFERGQFEFFNRKGKELLWDMAKSKRRKSYNLIKPNFIGSFTNQYPLSEEAYKLKKSQSLQRFKERHVEMKKEKVSTKYVHLCQAIKLYADKSKIPMNYICKELGLAENHLYNSFARVPELKKLLEIDEGPDFTHSVAPIIKDKLTGMRVRGDDSNQA